MITCKKCGKPIERIDKTKDNLCIVCFYEEKSKHPDESQFYCYLCITDVYTKSSISDLIIGDLFITSDEMVYIPYGMGLYTGKLGEVGAFLLMGITGAIATSITNADTTQMLQSSAQYGRLEDYGVSISDRLRRRNGTIIQRDKIQSVEAFEKDGIVRITHIDGEMDIAVEKIDEELVVQIKDNLSKKTTEELVEIWIENNREDWSDEAFEAIERILTERGENLPGISLIKTQGKGFSQGNAMHMGGAKKFSRYIKQWLSGNLPEQPDTQGANLKFPPASEFLDLLKKGNIDDYLSLETIEKITSNQTYGNSLLLAFKSREKTEQEYVLRAISKIPGTYTEPFIEFLKSEKKRYFIPFLFSIIVALVFFSFFCISLVDKFKLGALIFISFFLFFSISIIFSRAKYKRFKHLISLFT